MPNLATSHLQPNPQPAENAYMLFKVATLIESRIPFPPQRHGSGKGLKRLCAGLKDRAIETVLSSKLKRGTLSAKDLQTDHRLDFVERFLERTRPEVSLRDNPSNRLLYGEFANEMNEAINALISSSELDPIDPENLSNLNYMRRIESHLSKLYPEIDFSEDPSSELLEGDWKKEMDDFIENLISDPGDNH